MPTDTLQRERGQAIVLLVFTLIGLLGFAGLAIDGGNLYSEQRRAQQAADNAVLAAAYQYAQRQGTAAAQAAAIAAATSNGYTQDGTVTWVAYNSPPTSGAYAGVSGYFQVTITHTVQTALIHLVYSGPARVTVTAVSFAISGGPPVDGHAIAAMDPHGCGIVQVNGSAGGGIVTTGGGIYANSDGSDCTGGNMVLDCSGSGTILKSTPPYQINIVATTHTTDSCVEGTVITGAAPLPTDPLADMAEPNCDALYPGATGTLPGSGTVNPGKYHSVNATGTMIFNPGIYCIMDSGNNIMDMGPSGVISGTGVVFYVKDGEVNLQQGTLQVSAPTATNTPACAGLDNPLRDDPNSVCYYLGIVFYMGKTNTSRGITLNGQANWQVDGTIYAKSSANDVTLSGNANWQMNGQVLAYNVVASGGSAVTVNFDPSLAHVPPPTVALRQ